MTKGRPLSRPPRIAYDVRRYLTLVEVLAMDKSDGLKLTDFRTLARGWGVGDDGDFSTLLTRLAQHVIEYHTEVETQ